MHRGVAVASVSRGGLSSWQKKKAADCIEDHLDEDISLQTVKMQDPGAKTWASFDSP
jgi:hypothetical protein